MMVSIESTQETTHQNASTYQIKKPCQSMKDVSLRLKEGRTASEELITKKTDDLKSLEEKALQS